MSIASWANEETADRFNAERGRVLLVGGQEGCWDAVTADLEEEGIKAAVASSGTEALLVPRRQLSLVVLDADLPDIDGIAVCRALRAKSHMPIIIVTADATEDAVLACFDAGADDCVVKPIRVLELCARMRAAMRKAARLSPERRGSALEIGNIRLDPVQHDVTVAGRWLHMPAKEFGLLEMLLASPGRIVRRELIMQQVWGRDRNTDTKTLDAHVNRLRQRLQDVGATASITTVRGRGYRFELVPAGDAGLVLSA